MRFLRFLAVLGLIGVLLGMIGLGVGFTILHRYSRGLPNYRTLESYNPEIVTRVHAADGRLMAEFAREKRIFVPINAIPKRVIHAFLSAEDKTFYQHHGIDFIGVMSAIVDNMRNAAEGKRPRGASTITQQVAKNFLLTNEVSIDRKVKEAILSFRIERAYSKDRILELYLNEIYLGEGAYGVAAAAMQYFNKSLDELSLEDVAFLATLPKAPNNYNPRRKPKEALERRDWVLGRMAKDGFASAQDVKAALEKPIQLRARDTTETVNGSYFTEEVRRTLLAQFGENALYGGGLSVRTTLNPRLQEIAHRALREGLITFDRRKGWRGPVQKLGIISDWPTALGNIPKPAGAEDWSLALVLDVSAEQVKIGLADRSEGFLGKNDMDWVKATRRTGVANQLAIGDVVLVEKEADVNEKPDSATGYRLRQIPVIEGALVAMDPHTGRIQAMMGGFSPEMSSFNRATQAKRQPGSAFKPFVYAAALDSGFTPSSLILDAPITIDQGPGIPAWRPENYSKEYYGPTPLRVGLEKSRNLMTVRLAQIVGMTKIADYVRKCGVAEKMPRFISASLGSIETTPLDLTSGYATFVNGGRHVKPYLIERVQDKSGKTIARADNRPCEYCNNVGWGGQKTPDLVDPGENVLDPMTAYQMVSLLEGVVQRGTGKTISELEWPLAGKTGTTNDSKDVWFVGFSPNLAVGVFVGYDSPRSLGEKETGGSVAAPIFKAFMKEALHGQPATPFRIAPGMRLVRVNPATGRPAAIGDTNAIWEAFKPNTGPTIQRVLAGVDAGNDADGENDAYRPVLEPGATSSQPPADGNVYQPRPAVTVPAPSTANTSGTGGLY